LELGRRIKEIGGKQTIMANNNNNNNNNTHCGNTLFEKEKLTVSCFLICGLHGYTGYNIYE